MLRNLEKNVIFRAIIITKKILHKSKKKKRFPVSLSAQAIVQIMVPFPFTSQRYYQFSRFILQYNKMHHIFCYLNNNVYFFISLIDIQPKMGQINIRKK